MQSVVTIAGRLSSEHWDIPGVIKERCGGETVGQRGALGGIRTRARRIRSRVLSVQYSGAGPCRSISLWTTIDGLPCHFALPMPAGSAAYERTRSGAARV